MSFTRSLVSLTIIGAACLGIGTSAQAQVVKAVGANTYGQLGDTTGIQRLYPIAVEGLGGEAIDVKTGNNHSLALMADGTVRAWGRNVVAQMGLGYTSDEIVTPITVPGLSNIVAIAACGSFSLALRSDGVVFAWGLNQDSQCGQPSSNITVNTPTQVPWLTGVTAIDAGLYHGVALRSDGTVWSWGRGTNGQLGNGLAQTSATPVMAAGVSNVTKIAAGYFFTVALRNDGTLMGWGAGGEGQLGSTGTLTTAFPITINGATNVVDVACGGYHTLAVRFGTRQLFAWGGNTHGQLGIGSTSNTSTPTLTGLTNIKRAFASMYSSAAIDQHDGLHGWGRNNHGQLSSGTTVDRSRPAPFGKLLETATMSISEFHSLIITIEPVSTTPETCPGDLNGDNKVDVLDLLQLLGSWGVCPQAAAATAGSTR